MTRVKGRQEERSDWKQHKVLFSSPQVFIGHSEAVSKVIYTPDSQSIISTGEAIYFWDNLGVRPPTPPIVWVVVWISTPPIVWVVCSLNLNTPYHVSGLWFNFQHPLLCEWPVVWILTPPTCEWSVVWILTPPTCEWPVVWILTPPVMWVVCGLNLAECGWWNRKVQATDSCAHWRYTYGDGWLPTMTTLCVWPFSFYLCTEGCELNGMPCFP